MVHLGEQQWLSALIQKLVNVPFIVIAVYFNLLWFIPKFLLNKKSIIYILLLTIFWWYGKIVHIVAVQYLIPNLIDYLYIINNWINSTELYPAKIMMTSISAADFITDLYFALLLSTLLALYLDKQKRERQVEELHKHQLQAQLQYLRGQIHPHFLMNVLNTFYSRLLPVAKDTAEMLMGFSELMRYMLYESDKMHVPLSDEITMVKNYIELEQMRFGDKLQVNISVTGDYHNIIMAPGLLIVFIENCFKHGIYDAIETSWLALGVEVNPEQILIKVENSVTDVKSSESIYSGLGLDNVRKRLALLYPAKHRLNVYSEAESFLVVLKIEREVCEKT